MTAAHTTLEAGQGTPPDLAIMLYDARGSGVVRNALRIASACVAAGLTVEVWLAEETGHLAATLPKSIVVRSYGMGPARLGRTGKLALSIPGLARLIRQVRPRLLLSPGNHMHIAASLAHRMAGRPVESALIMRASNATWRRTFEAARGTTLPRPLAAAVDRTNRLLYASASHTIAVCEELRGHLQHDLGLPPDRLSVIANGVDVEEVRTRAGQPLDHPWLAKTSGPLVVAVGRLSRQKNFEALLEGFAILRRRVPARLAIIGENIAGGEARLRQHINRLGLADSVLLAGFDANPFRWMRAARIVAVTSRFEGSSNVVLEGLASGTPVVAFNCPTGIAEVLAPVAPANVIEQGDTAALAARMAQILAEPLPSRDAPAVPSLSAMLQAYAAFFTGRLG
ncbi:MAG: glycosyltransferase [Hyphomicrobiales bacterium]